MKKMIMVALVEPEVVDEISSAVVELVEKKKGKIDIQVAEGQAPPKGAGATLGGL